MAASTRAPQPQPVSLATQTRAGLMSGPDKLKLDYLIADWADTNARYFFLDNENGNDNNVGYIDAAPGSTFTTLQAGAVALKTWTRLLQIWSRFGAGRIAVVLIKSRSDNGNYKAQDGVTDDQLLLQHFYGYRQIVIRGSTDLTNSVTDRLLQGARTALAGPNGDGSFTVAGGATTTNIPIAAGSLTAEPALCGLRIRFTGNVTAALANVSRMINANTSGTGAITSDSAFPVAPAAGDTFLIEDPGVAFASCDISVDQTFQAAITGQSFTRRIALSGIRLTGADALRIQGGSPLIGVSFVRTTSGASTDVRVNTVANTVSFSSTMTDETITGRGVGFGLCCDGAGSFNDLNTLTMTQCSLKHATSLATFNRITSVNAANSGNFFYAGFTAFSCREASFGNNGIAGFARARVFAGNGGGGGSLVFQSCGQVQIRGLAAANLAGTPLIRFRGNMGTVIPNGGGTIAALDDIVVTGSNSEVMVDLALAVNVTLYLGRVAANSFTSIVGGDLRFNRTALGTLADLAVSSVVDRNNNAIYGVEGWPDLAGPHGRQPTAVNGGAAIAVGIVVRGTGTGPVVTPARADTVANAKAVCGVTMHSVPALVNQPILYKPTGLIAIKADAAPTIGNIAYLSEANAGQMRDTPPAVAGTNQKVRLGRIVDAAVINGLNYGLVYWEGDTLVYGAADGNP